MMIRIDQIAKCSADQDPTLFTSNEVRMSFVRDGWMNVLLKSIFIQLPIKINPADFPQ
ncbi:hypothetical protein HDF17_001916 [Granulicella arctica]|uniref:Uncharacterized protein n=1 Tax=Granulicella arctica TaxID=940613 RepID=A0A7Y9PI68_9BACT|nr:hypothetical protein [Granulicella arctica]